MSKRILSFVLFFNSLILYGQNDRQAYSVDSTIKESIAQKVAIRQFTQTGRDSQYKEEKGLVEFQVYEDDSLKKAPDGGFVFSTYLSQSATLYKDNRIMMMQVVRDKEGHGFLFDYYLYLIKDSVGNYFTTSFIMPGANVRVNDKLIYYNIDRNKSIKPRYKYRITDTALIRSIHFFTNKVKLKLTNEPQFKNGDILEGILELETPTYYKTMNDEKQHTFKIKLIGYFKIKVDKFFIPERKPPTS